MAPGQLFTVGKELKEVLVFHSASSCSLCCLGEKKGNSKIILQTSQRLADVRVGCGICIRSGRTAGVDTLDRAKNKTRSKK